MCVSFNVFLICFSFTTITKYINIHVSNQSLLHTRHDELTHDYKYRLWNGNDYKYNDSKPKHNEKTISTKLCISASDILSHPTLAKYFTCHFEFRIVKGQCTLYISSLFANHKSKHRTQNHWKLPSSPPITSSTFTS